MSTPYISPYLTQEECDRREAALVRRIVDEHTHDGPYTFDPESDYWRLPPRLQSAVAEELHP